MSTIGSIYQNCFSAIQASDKLAIEKVGWIPDTIISRLYVGDLSVTYVYILSFSVMGVRSKVLFSFL